LIQAGDEPPSMAIVDWMMPGLDGIELCRRIRADLNPSGGELPKTIP
jgi:DNA-binding response OmpR family regulator